METTKKNGKRISQGFTLSELLIAVLLLCIMTAAAATGITAAVRTESKVVDEANAQLLLSTGMIELRNELTGATEITVENNVITYRSERTGNYSTISSTENGIIVNEYIDSESGGTARRLVTASATTRPLEIRYGSVEMDDESGIITFRDLIVTRNGSEITDNPEFAVRAA